MADQKVERDLPAELQIVFVPQQGFWMKFHDKSMKMPFLTQLWDAVSLRIFYKIL